MQNSPTEYPEYSEYHTLEVTNDFNDLSYENESVPLLTNPLPQRTVSQQNNNPSMHQNLQIFFNSINTFEEIINRQLEQVNELKRLLNQMRQSFITQQQQTPMPCRISRNYVTRPHPYLNERLVSSRTPTIRSAVPTYSHESFTEQLASNSLHRQQTNVPAETTDNEIFSSDIQNYGFW